MLCCVPWCVHSQVKDQTEASLQCHRLLDATKDAGAEGSSGLLRIRDTCGLEALWESQDPVSN